MVVVAEEEDEEEEEDIAGKAVTGAGAIPGKAGAGAIPGKAGAVSAKLLPDIIFFYLSSLPIILYEYNSL